MPTHLFHLNMKDFSGTGNSRRKQAYLGMVPPEPPPLPHSWKSLLTPLPVALAGNHGFAGVCMPQLPWTALAAPVGEGVAVAGFTEIVSRTDTTAAALNELAGRLLAPS